jgi:membrane-bound metal-dependent hydrolase YbcI (DUF457 family)
MMGTTHSVTGMALWAGLGPMITQDPLELFAGLVISAVLPYGADLDHPNSTSSRKIWGPLHRHMGKGIAAMLGGHRMGAHSLAACLLAGLSIAALVTAVAPESATALGLAGLIGWFGGVFGDMLTKKGVGFFWPLSRRRFGIPIFTTNTLGEQVFNVAQALTGAWFAYLHFGGSL